jgi:hypothetical protein
MTPLPHIEWRAPEREKMNQSTRESAVFSASERIFSSSINSTFVREALERLFLAWDTSTSCLASPMSWLISIPSGDTSGTAVFYQMTLHVGFDGVALSTQSLNL